MPIKKPQSLQLIFPNWTAIQTKIWWEYYANIIT